MSWIKGLRVVTEAYRPVLTFINGEYWGVQSMREKLDDKFFKREFNIDENDIEVLEMMPLLKKVMMHIIWLC